MGDPEHAQATALLALASLDQEAVDGRSWVLANQRQPFGEGPDAPDPRKGALSCKRQGVPPGAPPGNGAEEEEEEEEEEVGGKLFG